MHLYTCILPRRPARCKFACSCQRQAANAPLGAPPRRAPPREPRRCGPTQPHTPPAAAAERPRRPQTRARPGLRWAALCGGVWFETFKPHPAAAGRAWFARRGGERTQPVRPAPPLTSCSDLQILRVLARTLCRLGGEVPQHLEGARHALHSRAPQPFRHGCYRQLKASIQTIREGSSCVGCCSGGPAMFPPADHHGLLPR